MELDGILMIALVTFLNFDSLGLEKFAQFLNLLFELSNELRVGVFIDNSFAYNGFGTIGISF